jgi:hypothetical protein
VDNGDVFNAFTEESARILGDKKVVEYFQEPLPSSMDEEIARMIDRFMGATSQQQEWFQVTLSQVQRSLFGIYGHRAATLSLREQSRERLLNGLVGATIANYVIPDKRRVEVSLAVYHHCARKLGANTVDLFEQAADYATPGFAQQLLAFGRRSDVTLARFGWKELQTPEGVRFKFDWG